FHLLCPATETSEISTLSLHDALPILHPLASWNDGRGDAIAVAWKARAGISTGRLRCPQDGKLRLQVEGGRAVDFRISALPLHNRSEEHTSELQSRENLVCRLLLEKKK